MFISTFFGTCLYLGHWPDERLKMVQETRVQSHTKDLKKKKMVLDAALLNATL